MLLEEIQQYHSVVKDFSNQSTSIKKLSITLYLTFLSIYYSDNIIEMQKSIFIIIGLLIPVFSYLYEIYVDFVRQKIRIKMQNKIIQYQIANEFENNELYHKRKLVIQFFGFRMIRRKKGVKFFCKSNESKYVVNKKPYYVNLLHFMYFIYIIEAFGILLAGVFK